MSAVDATIAKYIMHIMRRRWLLLALGLVATMTISTAWAGGIADVIRRDASVDAAGALMLPIAPPEQASATALAFEYADRSADEVKLLEANQATQPRAGQSVGVSAIVLPTVTLVQDEEGLAEVWINTPSRDARQLVYQQRIGGVDGAPTRIDPRTWAQARAALADATGGQGRIWMR